MIHAIILICGLSGPCTPSTLGVDVRYVDVPMTICGMASQTILAGEADAPSRNRRVVILCRK